MIGLTAIPQTPTYLVRYILIRDSKHKKTRVPLTAQHALIEARYKKFSSAIATGTLERIKESPRAIAMRDDLRSCYNGITAPLKLLKKDIKAAQPKRRLKYCPMCGTTLPTTFDHYLPATKFPEFSVHPLNLVPCCSRCNSTKDDDWLCPAGKRQFLHAYTDTLPDIQFLSVYLVEHPTSRTFGAIFSLNRPAGMNNETWNLLDKHFTRLGLIEKYNEQCNDEIAQILSTCKIFLNEAPNGDARSFLNGLAADRASIYGRNHWLAVLMDAISGHVNFPLWVAAA